MKKTHSLKNKVIFVIFITVIPIIGLLFILNHYAMYLIQEKIFENSADMLGLNMTMLDDSLQKVSNYLSDEKDTGIEIQGFTGESQEEKYHASMYYSDRLQEHVYIYDTSIEGMFVYSMDNRQMVSAFNDNSKEYLQRVKVLNYVKDNCKNLIKWNRMWITYEMDGEEVMLCVSGDDKVLFGAWTSYDTLLRPTRNWKAAQNGRICFVTEDGKIYADGEENDIDQIVFNKNEGEKIEYQSNKKFFVTNIDSSIGDFKMVDIVEKSKALGVFNYIKIGVCTLALIFLLILLPYLLLQFERNLFFPIFLLENGMKKVEGGELDTQIVNVKTTRELEHLILAFNEMITQIRNLKIQTYEDELQKQEMEIKYKQIQIEPHFYLNALNLINTMAQVQDTKLIQQLTENLSAYMRYIVNTENGRTTIKEEMEHVSHYLKIMEIRFGTGFQFHAEVDPEIEKVEIPSLLVQMLVENSMKYAFDVYGNTSIKVTIRREENEIVIIETDNGNGYPESILKEFGKEYSPKNKQIGLKNILFRLQYMYPDRTKFELSNICPHGAQTKIIIHEIIGE